MKSHELAKLLLSGPNLPIATHANNADYFSFGDERTHGRLKVAIVNHYSGPHLGIGNYWKKNLNSPNWMIEEMISGSVREE